MPDESWKTDEMRETERLIASLHAQAIDRARARREAAGEPMGDDLWAMFMRVHPELRGDDA